MESSRIKNLKPYVPGEQPKDRAYIKLNANENPYPPSPKVISSVSNFLQNDTKKIAFYPDPDSINLKIAIADFLNKTGGVLARTRFDENGNAFPSEKDAIPFKVTEQMIYCGNGSDEVLSFLFYAFFESGVKIFLPEFTYSFYPVYCNFYDIPYECVQMKSDFSIDVERLVSLSKKNDSPCIIANPNAPSGIGLSKNVIRGMIQSAPKNKVFVVDEAYVDFGGESVISLLEEFSNLIIVRTFSKSMSGAGLRLGYAVSHPNIINTLTTVKNSVNHFPIDSITQVAGSCACKDIFYYAENVKKIIAERERLYNFLLARQWDVVPSCTNFLFAKKDGISGKEIYQAIKDRGVLVRHFPINGIEDWCRISIGTKSDIDKLCSIIEKL